MELPVASTNLCRTSTASSWSRQPTSFVFSGTCSDCYGQKDLDQPVRLRLVMSLTTGMGMAPKGWWSNKNGRQCNQGSAGRSRCCVSMYWIIWYPVWCIQSLEKASSRFHWTKRLLWLNSFDKLFNRCHLSQWGALVDAGTDGRERVRVRAAGRALKIDWLH